MYVVKTIADARSVRENIISEVSDKGFTLVRGLMDRDKVRSCVSSIYNYANTAPHKASSGVAPHEIRTNMSKWSVGGQSLSQSGLPRFMLTIYNPLFEEDAFGLHEHFRTLVEFRDMLADREPQTDDMLKPERFNACRVQIYPAGGGFMGAHTDSRASSNLQEEQGQYIQLVMLLTERGTDYNKGGAFVTHNGSILDSEDNSMSGDILVYDGSTSHGVSDIDSNLPLNLANLAGRAVALVTIYNNQ